MLNNQIQEIVKKLTEELDPDSGLVRIYAYGSRVRGDEEVGSDLDLLVELKRVTPEIKRQIQDRAWELSLDSGFVISVLIVNEAVFERGPLSVSEFAENIRRHGVEVVAS
jgi:predicted nucleotidyltransferase